jgi:predicted ferric reductase
MLILSVGLMSLQPYGSLLRRLARGGALLGYQASFLAILSSSIVKQMRRAFGRPFISVHHILSVAGLVLLVIHPILLAIDAASARVLLPKFDSLVTFFRWGGPPTLILFALASLIALLRRAFRRRWRLIHLLTYVAFWMGTAHGVLLGADLQLGLGRAAAIVMAVAVLAVPIYRRVAKRRR